MQNNDLRMKRIKKVIDGHNAGREEKRSLVAINKSGRGKRLGIFAAAAMLVMTSITVFATTYKIDTTNIFNLDNSSINALSSQFPAGEFIFKGGDQISVGYSNVGESSFCDIYVYKQLEESITNLNPAYINQYSDSMKITEISHAHASRDASSMSVTANLPSNGSSYYLVTGVCNNGSRKGDDQGRWTQIKVYFYVMGLDVDVVYYAEADKEDYNKQTIHRDITISDYAFSKEGYECIGWSRTPNATEPEFVKGDVIKLTDPIIKSQFSATGSSTTASGWGRIDADNKAELTLYAVWKKTSDSSDNNNEQTTERKETTQKLESAEQELQIKGANYTIVSQSDNTVAYAGPINRNATSYKVPYMISRNGVSYHVTEIAPGAFSGCKKAKKITISTSIVKIGDSAFEGCSKLTSIELPTKVKEIGERAFYNCKKLSKLSCYSGKLKKVGKNALGKTKKGIRIITLNKYKAKYKKLFKKSGAKGAKY